jgi:hypothetical protein
MSGHACRSRHEAKSSVISKLVQCKMQEEDCAMAYSGTVAEK